MIARERRAFSEKAALDAFCNSEPYRYDLTLMDVLTPAMDGCTATEGIRNSGKEGTQDIKIIVMAKNGHLAKPIGLTGLSVEMEEWL